MFEPVDYKETKEYKEGRIKFQVHSSSGAYRFSTELAPRYIFLAEADDYPSEEIKSLLNQGYSSEEIKKIIYS